MIGCRWFLRPMQSCCSNLGPCYQLCTPVWSTGVWLWLILYHGTRMDFVHLYTMLNVTSYTWISFYFPPTTGLCTLLFTRMYLDWFVVQCNHLQFTCHLKSLLVVPNERRLLLFADISHCGDKSPCLNLCWYVTSAPTVRRTHTGHSYT